MQKTNIEWTDYTWNPIKGICPVGCWYCYGRKIYERFKLYPEKRFLLLECAKPLHLRKPSRIFVCSTFELFHPVVNDRQRELIFRVIKKCPQHTFQILTKFPQNIDRDMPDNVWLGITITGNKPEDFIRASEFGLRKRKAKIQFISYEPLLEEPVQNIPNIDWIIIGKLTGHGKKYDPKKELIEKLVSGATTWDTPIFLKNNLKEIWGEPLIQEMPE